MQAIEVNATKSESSWLFKYLDNDESNKVSYDEIRKLIDLLNRIQ